VPEEYKKKKPLKIGRVSLDLNEKDNGKKIIIIKPDPDQGPDNQDIARNWINNTFLKKSPYKSGIVSFSEKEWKAENGAGDKFVDGIKQSPHTITWADKSEHKTIMKGLKSLRPTQAQMGIGMNPPPGMDPASGMGGLPGASSPFGGQGELAAGLGGGLGTPNIGNIGGLGSPGNSPGSELSHRNVDDMKKLVRLMESGKTTFKEYIDKMNKKFRKSGPVRKVGIKTILGNPRLSIPITGDDKKDDKRRYKKLGKKF